MLFSRSISRVGPELRLLSLFLGVSLLFPFLSSGSTALVRVPNTTLRLPAALPGSVYKTPDAFPGLTFSGGPVGMATPPGETNRLFVIEKAGRISVITNLASPNRSIFLDLTPRSINSGGECGVLGLAFHPGYATNGYFFVFYSFNQSGLKQRVSRFQCDPPDASVANLATERPLITQIDDASNHNGGDLHFGPDGYLYVSLGDEGGGNDTYNNSQRIDKDFFSGILRLDVDGLPENLDPNPHPSLTDANRLAYKVPADNPWVGATSFNGKAVVPTAVRTEFYAVGLRNPWRFSFDPLTGLLYCGDVGQDAREEIDIIVKGGNYGWAFREASIAGPKPNSVPANTPSIPPIYEYRHAGGGGTETGNSVTGGVVYRGQRFPELIGFYVFADYVSGGIWAIQYDGSQTNGFRRLAQQAAIAALGVDPRNGDILFAGLGDSKLRRLERETVTTGFTPPASLADTGAFSDLQTLQPQPGIVPYTVAVPFWSDGAIKQRWFSLVNTNPLISYAALASGSFPTGAVWIKHFELVTNEVTQERRRLETRFIVRAGAGVYGLTYRWDPSGANASLVAEGGLTEPILIQQDGGNTRTQQWVYPSRNACLVCHNSSRGGILGFNPPQLNCDFSYPSGVTTNQLVALRDAGYLDSSLPSLSQVPKLYPATDLSASLESRVRSYLEANCSACHRPRGIGPATWDSRIEITTEETQLFRGLLNNSGGDPENRLVVPRDPDHSMLLQRISVRGPGQMPPLASTELDRQAIALLTEWIQSRELAQRASYSDWASALLGGLEGPLTAPEDDLDKDGASNGDEFRAGTDPTLASEVLSLVVEASDGGPRLRFTQPANRRVSLEASASLERSATWTALDLDLDGPRYPISSVQRTVALPVTDRGLQYYRVRVTSP